MAAKTVKIHTGKRHSFLRKDDIRHVFVLMLENRSFDHVFGFSGVPGINGLTKPTGADPAAFRNYRDKEKTLYTDPHRMADPMYVIYNPDHGPVSNRLQPGKDERRGNRDERRENRYERQDERSENWDFGGEWRKKRNARRDARRDDREEKREDRRAWQDAGAIGRRELRRAEEDGYPGAKWGPGAGHSFTDIFQQLTDRTYVKGAQDHSNTPADMLGFAREYQTHGFKGAPNDYVADADIVMAGFGPDQLPIIHKLAREFAICDSWFCSVPGPTISNRLFAHAATSGGVTDWHDEYVKRLFNKLDFENGHIFKQLKKHNRHVIANERIIWKIFKSHGHRELPLTGYLQGMACQYSDLDRFEGHVKELGEKDRRSYTVIEPFYNYVDNWCGNSQHSHGNMLAGEDLIKYVYETVRRHDDVWKHSLLVITYDEHGGFFDHVAPPMAPAPGDRSEKDVHDKTGFDFRRFGVRVPAVIVSPWIGAGTVLSAAPGDSRQFDHTSILRTLHELWGLDDLTARDKNARSLLDEGILRSRRTDHVDLADYSGKKAHPTTTDKFSDESETNEMDSDDGVPLDEIPAVLFTEAMRDKLIRRKLSGRMVEELDDDEIEGLELDVAPDLKEILEGCDTIGKVRKYLAGQRPLADVRSRLRER